MDRFIEQIVGKRKNGLDSIIYMFSYVMMIIFAFFALTNITGFVGMNEEGGIAFDWFRLIFFVVFGGLAFLIYLYKDRLIVEYDYTLTNDELDVSSVYNAKKRKYLTCIDLKNVVQCGPAQGPAFKKVSSQPGIKTHRWYVNANNPIYYFSFVKKGEHHLVLLELNDEMVTSIRTGRELPKGVWYDAEGKSTMYAGIS